MPLYWNLPTTKATMNRVSHPFSGHLQITASCKNRRLCFRNLLLQCRVQRTTESRKNECKIIRFQIHSAARKKYFSRTAAGRDRKPTEGLAFPTCRDIFLQPDFPPRYAAARQIHRDCVGDSARNVPESA